MILSIINWSQDNYTTSNYFFLLIFIEIRCERKKSRKKPQTSLINDKYLIDIKLIL